MRNRDPPGLGDRGLLPYYAPLVEAGHPGNGLPVAVEFRHREWVNDDLTFRLLEEEGLAYVCVDEPQFKTLVPPVIHATADFAYVRLHGRNYKKWWVHEKPEWVPRLRTLERAAGRVFASMNNHRGGQATINGRMLKELLELGRAVTPAGCSTASSPGPA